MLLLLDSPYGLLLMLYSDNWSNSASLRDIRLQNLSDPEFDLSRSLKVKSNGAVGLPIYDPYKCLIPHVYLSPMSFCSHSIFFSPLSYY